MDAPGGTAMNRLDLRTVLDWVPTGSRVLDLGCGDGTFLARLRDERAAIGVGVDIDPNNLVAAVAKGLDVIQEDIMTACTASPPIGLMWWCWPMPFKSSPIHTSLCNVWSTLPMKRLFLSRTLATGLAGYIWESKVKCRCRAPCRYSGMTRRTSTFVPLGILKRCAQH